MIQENRAAWKYIFHEDLYIVNGPDEVKMDTDMAMEEPGPHIQSAETADVPSPVKYLGSNKKSVLILVNDTESAFLNEKDLAFLMRIVESGLKLSKTDIAVVNALKYQYHQIFDEVHHRYLMAFGKHQTALIPDAKKYSPIDHEGVKVLLADDLRGLADDREKKGIFWKALQTMFEIS
jgi:hypothetical protein